MSRDCAEVDLTERNPTDANRIQALTGLRIFAALAIVIHHLQGVLWLPAGAYGGIPLNQGVSFFFVLSGFILQHSYRSRIEPAGNIGALQFTALRFFRLWPCHIAVIALIIVANGTAALGHILSVLSAGQFASVLLLLQAWSPDIGVVFGINGPAWSISVELFFYAMFPLLCRQARVSALRPLWIGAAITAAWLAAVSLYMPGGNLETLGGTHPFARVFEFAVGISAYEIFSRHPLDIRAPSLTEFATVVLAGLAVATTPYLATSMGAKFSVLLAWWLGNSASFWAFALLIGVFFWQRGRVSRFAGWGPVAYLGEISFALYLVHQPVIGYLARATPWFPLLPLSMQVIVFTAIVLALSALLHHAVEKPCMRIARRVILPAPRVATAQGMAADMAPAIGKA